MSNCARTAAGVKSMPTRCRTCSSSAAVQLPTFTPTESTERRDWSSAHTTRVNRGRGKVVHIPTTPGGPSYCAVASLRFRFVPAIAQVRKTCREPTLRAAESSPMFEALEMYRRRTSAPRPLHRRIACMRFPTVTPQSPGAQPTNDAPPPLPGLQSMSKSLRSHLEFCATRQWRNTAHCHCERRRTTLSVSAMLAGTTRLSAEPPRAHHRAGAAHSPSTAARRAVADTACPPEIGR